MWRCGVAFLLLLSGEAHGYKPASPKRHDVFSGNGAFVLDVDPKTELLTMYAAGKRDQPLWRFQRDVWQEDYFVSNHGKVVAVVTWRFVQLETLPEGVCIEFWDQTGMFRQYTFAELCPNPTRFYTESGPVGSFWRKWRSFAEADGAALRVRTTDRFEYHFSLDDGRVLLTIPVDVLIVSRLAVAAYVIAIIWMLRRRGKKHGQISLKPPVRRYGIRPMWSWRKKNET